MKTEVLCQPAPREEHRPPHVAFGDVKLKSTQKFTYLSCIISSGARIDKAINCKLSKASSSLGSLYNLLWAR